MPEGDGCLARYLDSRTAPPPRNTGRPKTTTLQRAAGPAWAIEYAWDVVGRLSNLETPVGEHIYAYRPTAGGVAVGSDLVEGITLPNGAEIARAHDDLGRLTSTAMKAPDETILDGHAYPEFDAAHRRMKQTRTRGTVVSTLDFAYDDRDQLTGSTAKEANGTVRSHETFGYGYDPAGNVANRTAAFPPPVLPDAGG